MHLARTRLLLFLASLACASSVGVAFYLQQAFGPDPCALCMVQRAAFIVCRLLAPCSACHPSGPTGTRRYSLGLLLFARAWLASSWSPCAGSTAP
ncbi:disulfide bond formation protein B, partial [Pseudomonas syringae]